MIQLPQNPCDNPTICPYPTRRICYGHIESLISEERKRAYEEGLCEGQKEKAYDLEKLIQRMEYNVTDFGEQGVFVKLEIIKLLMKDYGHIYLGITLKD